MIDPKKIWSSTQLPTLPVVAVKLLDLIKDPETEIREIVAVIKTDPAIAAKILKATNSSFFGFKSEVTSIERAVPMLGTTMITSLAMSFALSDASMSQGPLAVHYQEYWKQSVVHGAVAELLGKQSRKGLEAEFFLVGLLMDLGRLAMLKTIPKEYLPVLDLARNDLRPLHEIEQEHLGVSHVDIGVQLMKNWQMPDALVAAVTSHHWTLENIQAQQNDSHFELVGGSALAAAIGDYFCTNRKGTALCQIREHSNALYGMTEDALQDFLEQASSRINTTGELFSVDMSEFGDPTELMAQANEQLSMLAMREHVAGTQAVAKNEAFEREKQELTSRNEELQKQVMHDPLTKVYNRNYFDQAIAREINLSGRTSMPVGLIFIDVDRFKKLNDTYGHQFGDEVLQRVAKLLGDDLRTTDILARFGGEEFVILVSQPTEKGLEKLAERIRAKIEAEKILYGEEVVPVTASFGVAFTISNRDPSGLCERLIAAADEAMYEAKQTGRNRVCLRCLLDEQERRLYRGINQSRFSRWLVSRGVFDIPTVSKALLGCKMESIHIGQLAIREGYLTPPDVEQVLSDQEVHGDRFGITSIRLELLTEEQVVYLLALQQETPQVVASALIKQNLLDQPTAQQLIQDYLSEAPHSNRSSDRTPELQLQ
ncbi:MAG: GGDEF domain-containing protein [Planctomycetota bacterium]|nr:GGDEF domain-containing protein [Planctomycetota bacterium]